MSYKQLTRKQRYQIYALKKTGQTQAEIARCLGVHKSTISRGLKRNCGQRGYRPKQAHQKAMQRRKEKVRYRIRKEDWMLIEEKIRLDWSPEQISEWLKKEHTSLQVSHEWIYQHIYADKQAGDTLYQSNLRRHKKRRKRYGRRDRRGQIPPSHQH